MNDKSCNNHGLINEFSMFDKIVLFICFWGVILIGAYSIFSFNVAVGIIYIIYSILSLSLLALYTFCPYCPYPKENSECLFFPVEIVNKIGRKPEGPMTKLDKGISAILLALIYLIPQYWLFKDLFIFSIFWIFVIVITVRTNLYLCKRCRFYSCPFNSTNKELQEN